MTKRWGLDLDMSAVRLMRLDDGTWVEEAIERIDASDIEDRLHKMLSVIEDGEPVELFLPRDQILYTDVTLSEGDPKPQIERALDGLTPYALDELSFDWETTAPDTARIAAIALDTLDEAAAFAEVRSISIGGYSSLAETEDFPRQPRFAGPSIKPEPEMEAEATPGEAADEPSGEAPAFASARKPSRPPGTEVEAASAAIKSRITPTAPPADAPPPAVAAKAPEPPPVEDNTPVIEVDDPTPVMSVKPPNVPLDPGIPIAAPNAPPRVRTDIAAASVSGPVASLTPPASIKLRNRATPQLGVAAVFLVAFLATIGVAILVWNLLPMRPGTTTVIPPAAESSDDVRAPVETDFAETPEAEPEAPPTTEEVTAFVPQAEDTTVAEPIPEPEPEPEPAPAMLAAAPLLAAPETGTSPHIAALAPTIEKRARPESLFRALRDGSALPDYDPNVPDAPAPAGLTSILTASPFPGPDPDIEQVIDDIYFASIERADLGFDAIALPDPRLLSPDRVPRHDSEAPEVPVPPVDSDAIAAALDDALTGPGGLIQTELAASLPDTQPAVRPGNVLEQIERQQFGGFTRDELAAFRPNPRPASAQAQALAAAAAVDASDLAVTTSLTPRVRPDGFSQTVAQARALLEADRVTASADFETPDTTSAVTAALEADAEPEQRPLANQRLNIPTSASVARQATMEDAIRLNRINLVGVYGTPSDRRALVRLANGRYIKVKVGDRVDGGTVARITDSSLQYRKGNRTVSLEIPQG